jgi:hypothetical protein
MEVLITQLQVSNSFLTTVFDQRLLKRCELYLKNVLEKDGVPPYSPFFHGTDSL